MADVEQQIIEIAKRAKSGEIPPGQARNNIFSLKKEYVRENSQQSPTLNKLTMLTESELHKHEILERKLFIKFGKYWLLPDVDSVLVQLDNQNEWQSQIIAIVSSKRR